MNEKTEGKSLQSSKKRLWYASSDLKKHIIFEKFVPIFQIFLLRGNLTTQLLWIQPNNFMQAWEWQVPLPSWRNDFFFLMRNKFHRFLMWFTGKTHKNAHKQRNDVNPNTVLLIILLYMVNHSTVYNQKYSTPLDGYWNLIRTLHTLDCSSTHKHSHMIPLAHQLSIFGKLPFSAFLAYVCTTGGLSKY